MLSETQGEVRPTVKNAVKAIAQYMDANRVPCKKEVAAAAEIKNFDSSGAVIGRSYVKMKSQDQSNQPKAN